MSDPRDDLDPQQRRVLSALLTMQRHSWEQGVTASALLDLGLEVEAEVAARYAVIRQTEDGKLGQLGDAGVVNGGALVEVVSVVADRTGDARLAAAARRQVEHLAHGAPRAADGTLFHMAGLDEMWIDTDYMAVPALVAGGEPGAAAQQLAGHRERLWDAGSGLYGWRWSEGEQRVIHPEHWGTGNGWVVAGIARALHLGGMADPALRAEADHAARVIDACLATRAPDGAFANVLDDPGSFAEGNVGQMLAYAVLTGVLDGWLPASYADVGRDLVRSARALVDDLGLVTPVCGSPRFEAPGVSPEAQAFFLLCTAAERRLDAA